MEFGMSCRIKPKEKYVHISMKEIWLNLDSRTKNIHFWLFFPFSVLIYAIPTTFVIPVVERWLEQEIVQWVEHEGLIW